MAQQHLDRLTSTDAGFLHQEGTNSHMHIGAVLVFDGPAPSFDELLDHVRGRLHLIPRYRQKLAHPPLETGRPVWIDDHSFNLEYHVRHSALPKPGTFGQLLRLTGRIASVRLDRTKPLWEMWLIEGLEPAAGSGVERFAIISKTHHALIDGVSGVDLAAVLFDITPTTPEPSTDGLVPWRPGREPSATDLMLSSIRGAVNTAIELGARAVGAAANPGRSVDHLRDAAEGVGEIARAALTPAPETPLNVPIGPHRRFRVVDQSLADYKLVKTRFGTTVNDVVLAVVAGGLAKWLRSRGLRTDGIELRALVPVSVRAAGERGEMGNRLSLIRAPLPLYVSDGPLRLEVVSRQMRALKESKQALGASTLIAVNDVAPPALLSQASKLQFSTRLFNLLVTNVPGPQLPLYILGREMRDAYPLAFLPENQALAVAVISYNGRVEYGLLADFDAVPDLDVVADGIEASLHELLAGATSEPTPGRQPQSPAAATARAATESRDRIRQLFAPGPQPDSVAESASAGPAPAPLPNPARRSKDGPAAAMRAKRKSPKKNS